MPKRGSISSRTWTADAGPPTCKQRQMMKPRGLPVACVRSLMRSNQGQKELIAQGNTACKRPPSRTERAASALSCSDRKENTCPCILAGCRLLPALESRGPTSTSSSRSLTAGHRRRRCAPPSNLPGTCARRHHRRPRHHDSLTLTLTPTLALTRRAGARHAAVARAGGGGCAARAERGRGGRGAAERGGAPRGPTPTPSQP